MRAQGSQKVLRPGSRPAIWRTHLRSTVALRVMGRWPETTSCSSTQKLRRPGHAQRMRQSQRLAGRALGYTQGVLLRVNCQSLASLCKL